MVPGSSGAGFAKALGLDLCEKPFGLGGEICGVEGKHRGSEAS